MEPIYSRFSSDPRMSEIISQFATALLDRSQEMAVAMASEDIDRLSRLAHNLKGSAGGYGFDSISEAAAELEQETLAVEADVSNVQERVESLIELCSAVHQA